MATKASNLIPEEVYKVEHFFELSQDLLCIAGYDGYFKKINPAVSKLLGYTSQELFARPINDFVYSDDKDVTAKVREKLTRNIPLLNFENRYVTKNGEIVWLSWTSMPLDSEKLVYAIAKDITYKKKLEEERNSLLANLTRINNDLKQLTYTTSHDLRSPVGNLLSIFNLLDISKIQDKEILNFVGILKLATESLKDTLNSYVDLLDKKDNLSVPVEELNLNDSLNVVLHSLGFLISNSNATFDIDFSELQTIKFNKAYLESIFLNLITNTIKYTKPNHAPVIHIHSKITNGVKQLIFADEGLGFDMDKVKDKIFGFRQKFHTHVDSKGIGLYLVYNHITRLGGKIAIESKINEGAKFIISFKE